VTVCGSDVFESYVLLAARENNRTPAEVCRENSERIRDDLRLLDVKMDSFLCPLAGEERKRLAAANHRLFRAYRDAGLLTKHVELLPFSRRHNLFTLGCWLYGKCPRCGAPAGCYACEECSAQYRPEELRDPECRLADSGIEWRRTETLAFRFQNLAWIDEAVNEGRISIAYADIVRKSLRSSGCRVRLSAPGTWGIELPPEVGLPGQVYHSSTALFAYATLAGEVAAGLIGRTGNVFDTGSDVTTVRLLGSDGAVHHVAGGLGGPRMLSLIKPFDYLIINAFYLFCGRKFSTSRRHAVWVRQAVSELGIPADLVRWYLAKTSPLHRLTDFDPDCFASSVEDTLVRQVNPQVERALRILGSNRPRSLVQPLRRCLDETLARQDRALALVGVDPPRAVAEFEAWGAAPLSSHETPSDAYWWLKGLSLLAYPILPEFGRALWLSLGHAGEPNNREFDATPPRALAVPTMFFSPLTTAQVSGMRRAAETYCSSGQK
jgi:methionyl-tRNA synthetase